MIRDLLTDLLAQAEAGRLSRARAIVARRDVAAVAAPGGVAAIVTTDGGRHGVRLAQVEGLLQASCDCADWQQRHETVGPCKHVLATVTVALASEELLQALASRVVHACVQPPSTCSDGARRAVCTAVAKLAQKVSEALDEGAVPFLVGPTGSGKTAAVKQAATARRWGLEVVAGAASFTDADLVGLRAPGMAIPGILARAFGRALRGETVLVFFDELTRFNPLATPGPGDSGGLGPRPSGRGAGARRLLASLGARLNPGRQDACRPSGEPLGLPARPGARPPRRCGHSRGLRRAGGRALLLPGQGGDPGLVEGRARGRAAAAGQVPGARHGKVARRPGGHRSALARMLVLKAAASQGFAEICRGLGLDLSGGAA